LNLESLGLVHAGEHPDSRRRVAVPFTGGGGSTATAIAAPEPPAALLSEASLGPLRAPYRAAACRSLQAPRGKMASLFSVWADPQTVCRRFDSARGRQRNQASR